MGLADLVDDGAEEEKDDSKKEKSKDEDLVDCVDCDGTGEDPETGEPCKACDGEGLVPPTDDGAEDNDQKEPSEEDAEMGLADIADALATGVTVGDVAQAEATPADADDAEGEHAGDAPETAEALGGVQAAVEEAHAAIAEGGEGDVEGALEGVQEAVAGVVEAAMAEGEALEAGDMDREPEEGEDPDHVEEENEERRKKGAALRVWAEGFEG